MRAHRVDANHGAIIDVFRKCGFSVFDTSIVGNGFPDCVVGFRNENYLVEIKDGKKKKLTPKEEEFFKTWKGKAYIMTSVNDVLEFVKNLR